MLHSVHQSCIILMDAVSTALSWLSLRHAVVYSSIAKYHVVVRLAFLVVFIAINLFIALPFVAWLTASIPGGFIWTSSLSLWEVAWVIGDPITKYCAFVDIRLVAVVAPMATRRPSFLNCLSTQIDEHSMSSLPYACR